MRLFPLTRFIGSCLGCAVLLMLEIARGASTDAIRVALMPFAVDDNSYRSTLAATDMANLLQAELSNEPGLHWVERSELKAAEREFELATLGFTDVAGALRRGHFTAADWIITGSFSIATNSQWNLAIKVVDVRRADVLASRTAELSRVAHPTLKSALPQVDSIVGEMRAVLRAATKRWSEVHGRRTLALLMLLDAEDRESELAYALETSTDGSKPWRVVRPGASVDSFGESEFVLLGLVQENPDAWERVAEAYVWGRLAIRHVPSADCIPVLEVTIWDDQGKFETISVGGKQVSVPAAALSQISDLIPRLKVELAAKLNQPRQPSSAAEIRARIAEALFRRAKGWGLDSEHYSKWRVIPELWVRDDLGNMHRTAELWSRDNVRQQVRMLEAACFFDPKNRSARELLLRIQTRRGYYLRPQNLKARIALCEGWGSYVERFGLSSEEHSDLANEAASGSVAGNYVMSAFHLADRAKYPKEEKGLPPDISNQLARKWSGSFVREFAERVAKTTNEPVTRSLSPTIFREGHLIPLNPEIRLRTIEALWPAFVASVPPGANERDYVEICSLIRRTCMEANRAGEAAKLLNMLNKPERVRPASNAPVRLPRATELEPRSPFQK